MEEIPEKQYGRKRKTSLGKEIELSEEAETTSLETRGNLGEGKNEGIVIVNTLDIV